MVLRMNKKFLFIIFVFLFFVFIHYLLFDLRLFYRRFVTVKTRDESRVDVETLKHHYGVIIDAGSSGSRLFIYTWPPHSGNAGELLQMRPLLDGNKKPIVKKVNPGLSSFADKPEDVASYIKPLLDVAVDSVPKSQHKETPFYLMATAGMRMISADAQMAILNNIRKFIKAESQFLFSDSHAKVITGQEEGIFGWITTNYLLGRFNHNHSDGVPIIPIPFSDSSFRSKKIHHRKRTVGVIDMGGGSMQIAYELLSTSEKETESAVTFNLGCRENDADHTYKVFVTTFLGFGVNAARSRYERMLVRDHNDDVNDTSTFSTMQYNTLPSNTSVTKKHVVIEDPCLHRGLNVTHLTKLVNDTQGGLKLSPKQIKLMPSVKTTFKGTGKYHQCESRLLSVLDKQPCPTQTSSQLVCTMSGRLHPPMDLFNSQFYGFSEFWYSTEDILGLGGKYNYFKLHSDAMEFCSKDWISLHTEYKKGVYKKADISRMKYQCFKSAWITNIFHSGLGFPNAFNKFISVQEINGAEVQWSLGALLFQTRYFPLRVIEQKEQDRKKQKEIRNKPKDSYVYIFLFFASFLVLATLIWMHNRHRSRTFWSISSYRKDPYKSSNDFDRGSPNDLFESIKMAHNTGPIRDYRSSPDFRPWL